MIAGALVAFALGVLAIHLATIGLVLWRRFRAPRPQNLPDPAPHITLLRPVCGLTDIERATLTSSFGLDYPDYEIIFCAARASDPAVPFLTALIAAHPEVQAQLLIGETPISQNPKLNNMQKGVEAAQGDWIAMVDSNLLLPVDYLQNLLGSWQGGTGLVSAPPIGTEAQNLWGAVECAFLNACQARWQIAADTVGFGFAQGKTMLWRRDTLEAAGGLPALGRFMAEDATATKLVRAQGLRVDLPETLFTQPVGGRSFRQIWERQLRWSKVRRDAFFWLFVAEVAQGPVLPLLACLIAVSAAHLPLWIALGYLLVWYGAEWIMSRLMGWPASARDLASSLLRDALLPGIWAATWITRDFVWHGTEMKPVTAPQPRQAPVSEN